jgi:hypothetical protein
MLPARHYVSDHTKWINDLLERDPRIVEDQAKGRAIWWDKAPRELAEREQMDTGSVPQKGYVYGKE